MLHSVTQFVFQELKKFYPVSNISSHFKFSFVNCRKSTLDTRLKIYGGVHLYGIYNILQGEANPLSSFFRSRPKQFRRRQVACHR